MAFKVLIGQKNSKGKVVQNPLKGNYYTDVVDFQNDDDKDEFLNQNFFQDGKNLENGSGVETPLKGHDEIHAEFTIDLEKTKFTRSEALRKDFCCIYDSNENTYKFYTMEAHLSSKQVYTTLSYVIELDLFFTYDIKKIGKENVSVMMQRGVGQNQGIGGATQFAVPNLSIDMGLSLDEEMGDGSILVDETLIMNTDIKGYLAFIKPKPRKILSEVSFNSGQTSPGNTTGADTLLINATVNGGGVSTTHLLFETAGVRDQQIQYSRPKNTMSYSKYPVFQQIDGLKKQDKYFTMYIDQNELTNVLVGEVTVADIFSSPDTLLVIPVFEPPDYVELNSQVIFETNQGGFINLTYNSTSGPFYIDFSRNNYRFKMLTGGGVTTSKYTHDLTNGHSVLSKDKYDVEQYAKLLTGNNFYYKIINGQKQSFNLQWELLKNNFSFTIERKRVFTLEGNFGLVRCLTGQYKIGGSRSDYTLDETDTIRGYQNNNEGLTYVSNNLTSINQSFRIQQKNAVLGLISGLSGAAIAATGFAGRKPSGAGVYGEQMLEPSKRAMEAGYTLLDNGKHYQGASLVRTGLSGFNQGLQTQANALSQSVGALTGMTAALSVVSNITSLLRVHDAIKQEKANLQAIQQRGNTVAATGSEYDRLFKLDNVGGLTLQTYSLPPGLKQKIADYFHMYGYKVETLSSPRLWLLNGLYGDYFQAEFNSLYQAFNETLSPQESKIAALSLSQGVRIWHGKPDIYDGGHVGDYSKRNIRS